MSLLTCTAVGSVFVDVMRYGLPQQALQHADTQTQTRAHTPTTPHAEAASATYQVSLYDASLGYPSLSTYCNTLQHTATRCNTLRHAATRCSTLQHGGTLYSALQHTATHCNTRKTMQNTATRCNTHQHTPTRCATHGGGISNVSAVAV